MKNIYYFLLCLMLSNCSLKSENTANELIYSTNNKGIFIYNCNSKTVRNVFATDESFIEGSIKVKSDSVLYWTTKYEIQATDTNSLIERIIKLKFYVINLNKNRFYNYKRIAYEEFKNQPSLKITENLYAIDSSVWIDTLHSIPNWLIDSDALENHFVPGPSTEIDSQAFQNGVYYFRKGSKRLKIDFTKKLNLNSGHYYDVTFSPNGNNIAFRYITRTTSEIYEIDISREEVKRILGMGFFNPHYSKDGKYILFKKREKKNKRWEWIDEIHLYNRGLMEVTKISDGEYFMWKN